MNLSKQALTYADRLVSIQRKKGIKPLVQVLMVLGCCFFNTVFSQMETFRTKFVFNESQLHDFISSLSIDSSQVYFNANDYTVYVYDKMTGVLNWSFETGYKSNNAPKRVESSVLVSNEEWRLLNSKTGAFVKDLSIQTVSTEPIFKNNILYCTAIVPEQGGAILAYDLTENEILWHKYIGHGISYQPFYLENKIVANYENQYWFELDYNGNALDQNSSCNNIDSETPFHGQFCRIQYDILNQFHKEIGIKNIAIEGVKYHYAKTMTAILNGNELKIINESNKLKKKIVLDEILKLQETNINDYSDILRVEESTVWFVYENTLAAYDSKNNQILKQYDLTAWNPYNVVLDGNNLWIISKTDGNLIALRL